MVAAALFPIAAVADAPAISSAGSAALPIIVESCGVMYANGGLLPLTKTSSGLGINFRNDSKVTASEVRFDVNMDGRHYVEIDKGTFSPDVEIKHCFRDLAGNVQFIISRQPQPTCSVLSATFADGTTWSAPAQAAPAPSLTQLVGTWSCQTAAGSTFAAVFTADADGNVSEHQTFRMQRVLKEASIKASPTALTRKC